MLTYQSEKKKKNSEVYCSSLIPMARGSGVVEWEEINDDMLSHLDDLQFLQLCFLAGTLI